jgi:hypothetical protein
LIKDRPAHLLSKADYQGIPDAPISIDFAFVPDLIRRSIGELGGIQPVTGAMATAADGILYDKPSAAEIELHRALGTKFQLIFVVVNVANLAVILAPFRLGSSNVEDQYAAADHNVDHNSPARRRLEMLAAFAPTLRNPSAPLPTQIIGKGTDTEPYRLGGSPRSELELEFSKMAYDAGWVIPEFSWSAWAATSEGKRLLLQPDALATAGEEDLAKALTAILRQERFSEGTVEDAIRRGTLLAAAERAQTLLEGAN